MEQQLTPQESLRLIESMIGQAKRSFHRISFYFLLWGVLLIVAMIVTFLLRDMPGGWGKGAAWGVVGIIGGLVSGIRGARQGKLEGVNNPMDRVIGWLWSSFVIVLMITIVLCGSDHRDPTPLITLLTGLPTFMTGQIMRFPPLIIGGILFWITSVAMVLFPDPLAITVLYCGAMLFGYIVPGLILERQENALRTA